jgi:carboxymethylenebutenolidase
MNSQDITIPVDGSQMPAYLARPAEGSGPHPAVVVLHEVFGFNPEIRRMTDLVATIGYVGLAVNYYHRIDARINEPYTEEGSRNAFAAAARLRPQDLTADVRAAAGWLNAQSFVKKGKIAVWGCGFGATAAFIASALPELCGAICFYPSRELPLADASEVRAPVLLVFGEQDYYVSPEEMTTIHSALQSAGKDVRMQIYPDVGHSFFRHGRPEAIVERHRYSDQAIGHAVADSWNLVQTFLRDVFNRPQSRAAETGDIHTTRTESIQS